MSNNGNSGSVGTLTVVAVEVVDFGRFVRVVVSTSVDEKENVGGSVVFVGPTVVVVVGAVHCPAKQMPPPWQLVPSRNPKFVDCLHERVSVCKTVFIQ